MGLEPNTSVNLFYVETRKKISGENEHGVYRTIYAHMFVYVCGWRNTSYAKQFVGASEIKERIESLDKLYKYLAVFLAIITGELLLKIEEL